MSRIAECKKSPKERMTIELLALGRPYRINKQSIAVVNDGDKYTHSVRYSVIFYLRCLLNIQGYWYLLAPALSYVYLYSCI